VRGYVRNLEEWIIRALAQFNVTGERRAGRVGIWVDRGAGREDKIAAIGVRVRRWVAYHGIAINVEPELSHFGGIVPCGIADEKLGVTSLVDLGLPVCMEDLDNALMATFGEVF
jgi:lipoyl(octanoyl) transferase